MRSVTDFFKKVVKSTNEQNEASVSAMSKSVEVTSAGTWSASSQLYSQQASSSNAVTTGTSTTNTNTNQGLRTIDSGPAQPQLAKFPLTMFGKIITHFLAQDFNDTK